MTWIISLNWENFHGPQNSQLSYIYCILLQEAVARAYDYELDLLKSAPEKSYLKTMMVKELLPKREYMAKFLREAGFKPIIPEAGYFMMADFSALGTVLSSLLC